jgi:hypothetical protein
LTNRGGIFTLLLAAIFGFSKIAKNRVLQCPLYLYGAKT